MQGRKVGDPPRTGSGRAPPEPLDRMETGGRARLDEHDEAQAPGRQGADLIGLDGAAEEAGRLGRDRQAGLRNRGLAACARPAPVAQRIAALEQRVVDPGGMAVTACVGGRGAVADQAHDLPACRPGGLGRRPLLEEGLLGRDLPFERAAVTAQANARQRRVRQQVGEDRRIGRIVLEALGPVSDDFIGNAPGRHPGGHHRLIFIRFELFGPRVGGEDELGRFAARMQLDKERGGIDPDAVGKDDGGLRIEGDPVGHAARCRVIRRGA